MAGRHINDDDGLRALLLRVRRIALLGASANEDRPSNEVMHWLLQQGYEIVPVNPGLAGKAIHGQTVCAKLADVAGPIDLVEVFRASDALPGIVDEMIAARAETGAAVLWTQLNVIHAEATDKAMAHGIDVVINRCPKIEFRRLRMVQRTR